MRATAGEKGPPWAFFLFAMGWSAVTLWSAGPVVRDFAREAISYAFQPVEARVVSYGVRSIDGGPMRYTLEYAYRAEDGEHVSLRRFPTPGPLPAEETLADLEARFRSGASITAYVNPFDSSDAITQPGFRGSTLFALLWAVPMTLAALGLWRLSWAQWRPRSPGQLSDEATVLHDGGGGWTLRVVRLAPWARAAFAGAVAALAALIVIGAAEPRPFLRHTVAAWAGVAAIAALWFVVARLNLRHGRYDWTYRPQGDALRTPQGRLLRRNELHAIVIVPQTRSSDGAELHDAHVRVRLASGGALHVVTETSHESPSHALDLARPIARFLAAGLAIPLEEPPLA